MAVVFAYDGASTVTATITDATPAQQYSLNYDGDSGSDDDTATAVTTTVILTVTVAETTGERFGVSVNLGAPLASGADFLAGAVFTAGTTTEYVSPTVWAFDGNGTLTATFTGTTGRTYGVQVLDADYGGSTMVTAVATGSSQTITVTPAQHGSIPFGGTKFLAYLVDIGSGIFSGDYKYDSFRLFTEGEAGAGTVGSDEVEVEPEFGPGRVCIAFDDGPLEASPTWTRIDHIDSLVAGIDIHRGRQTEFDQTDTSTATVMLHDTQGLFDPANTSSPYFGKLDGKQIKLSLWNPVAEEWVTQYRGIIDNYGHDLAPSQVVSNIQIECVDLFDYLAGVEMLPGSFGDSPPPGSEGTVFYEDTDFQTRIVQLLTDAGLPSDRRRVFTGNVDVQETKYDPGDSILVAVRDAVDAEFPGIANLYTDKNGRVCAHGRMARFTPDDVSFGTDWDFRRWPAGDGDAIVEDADRAQIRPPLTWSRPRSRIINAAIAYPRDIAETAMAGQIITDTDSITAYGYRSWSAPDLIVQEGTTTSNNANDETKLFADYYVQNYKDPRTRVEALTFKSLHPEDPRAEPTWALICGVDISDVVELKHGYPGGVGLDEDFYVEGSEMQIRPGPPEYDFVTLSLNVSPAAYFTTDVFTVV